jgi:predicted nucleic acid-binding protein
MAAIVLVDTNVLVYAHDPNDEEKRTRATEVLHELQSLSVGALSVQALSEFFAVVTRKFEPPMPVQTARSQVAALASSWPVFDVTAASVLEATRGVVDHQLSYWDSLVWAVARMNGMRAILTEDGHDGQVHGGVRYMNPFLASSTADVVDALFVDG